MSLVSAVNKKWDHAKHALKKMLQEGIHPKKLAWSVTCGVIIGLFPVFFTTTILALAISLVFRLNIIAVQLINYLLTPVQLLCIIPFLKAGEWLADVKTSGLTIDKLQTQFNHGFYDGMMMVMHTQLLAIMAWSIIAIPLTFIVFPLFHRIFKIYLAK